MSVFDDDDDYEPTDDFGAIVGAINLMFYTLVFVVAAAVAYFVFC